MAWTQEYITEFPSGKKIGIIETDTSTGNQVAKDFPTYKILGYYKAGLNHTEDVMHRIIAKGNILSSLIFNHR